MCSCRNRHLRLQHWPVRLYWQTAFGLPPFPQNANQKLSQPAMPLRRHTCHHNCNNAVQSAMARDAGLEGTDGREVGTDFGRGAVRCGAKRGRVELILRPWLCSTYVPVTTMTAPSCGIHLWLLQVVGFTYNKGGKSKKTKEERKQARGCTRNKSPVSCFESSTNSLLTAVLPHKRGHHETNTAMHKEHAICDVL